jgi:hypothetical protein
MVNYKSDKEVMEYFKPYTERKGSIYENLVTLYKPHKDVLSVRCDVISAFDSKSEMEKVKGYLRRNGFHSNNCGTYSRYKDEKGKVVGPYEWMALHMDLYNFMRGIMY